MKKIILITIILSNLVLAVNINEVMYNPIGNDNNNEFIEIKGTNNLSEYIIGDEDSNDTLELLYFNNESNFSLIVENEFNYTNINASIYSAGSTIGNNLGNTEDTVFLYFNNSLIDSIHYTNEQANDNGFSLQLVENEWIESSPTPGEENFKKINTQKEDITCSTNLSIKTDKEIYTEGETVGFTPSIGIEDNFILSYWITDLFGNFIRYPRNTTNLNTKKFTPKVYETENVYQIHMKLHSCNTTESEKNIIIKGEKIKESRISLKQIKNNDILFGDTIWANLNIYKGDIEKSRIYLYIKNNENIITPKQKLDIDNNYQQYRLSIPLKLPYNCNNKYKNGEYTLTAEGLDLIATENFPIIGNNAKICIEGTKNKKEEQLILLESPENITLNEEFQIKILLTNNEEATKEIKIWSYIYKGPVSLSGEREDNLQTINLPPKSNITTSLKMKAFENREGAQIKVKADFQGKSKELTIPISITEPEIIESKAEIKPLEMINNDINPQNEITSQTVYKSSNTQTKEISLYIFGVLLFLLCIWMVLRNGITNKDDSGSGRIPGESRSRGFGKSSGKGKQRREHKSDIL